MTQNPREKTRPSPQGQASRTAASGIYRAILSAAGVFFLVLSLGFLDSIGQAGQSDVGSALAGTFALAAAGTFMVLALRRRPRGRRGRASGHASTGNVFLCYAREDARHADVLQHALTSAGIDVWRDSHKLWPGQDWRANIRRAITDDALVFLACFSSLSTGRLKSFQNEELILAIEQARLRWPDDTWLIPVRFDDCEIPDYDLGAGRTLRSIQRADLFGDKIHADIERLVTAVSQAFKTK